MVEVERPGRNSGIASNENHYCSRSLLEAGQFDRFTIFWPSLRMVLKHHPVGTPPPLHRSAPVVCVEGPRVADCSNCVLGLPLYLLVHQC